MNLSVLIIPILAYLTGSISFGFLIAKLKIHDDIRRFGSKSIGASNISRVMGVSWGLLTVSLDIIKAVFFLFFLETYFLTGALFYDSILIALSALMIVLGHIYPLFLKFKGGKGVATFIGIMIYLFPYQTLIFLTLYPLILAITRYSSLTSILTVSFFPFLILFFKGFQTSILPYYWLSILLAGIIIFKHKDNIKRLKNGQEPKFTFKKKVRSSD